MHLTGGTVTDLGWLCAYMFVYAVFPQSTDIITWCRLPPLHLHLFLNWFVKKIVKIHPNTETWYKHFHQQPSEYHGGDWQGPQLYRLSRSDSTDFLRDLLETDAAPAEAMLYFNAMLSFIQVEH